MRKEVNWLANQIAKGKRQYFDEFYRITKGGMYYCIINIVKYSDAANDIMQESYISFLSNIDKLDIDGNSYSYLLQIGKNKALNYYNSNKRQQQHTSNIDDADISVAVDVDYPLLDTLRRRLPKEEFDIVELCIIHKYKQAEVAEMLGKPRATINWQYHNIMKKVKQYYKEVYND